MEATSGIPWRPLLLVMSVVGAFGFWFERGYRAPDAVAARVCRARYQAAATSGDTAAIDTLRTMTRDGVAASTCGELRVAGRTR